MARTIAELPPEVAARYPHRSRNVAVNGRRMHYIDEGPPDETAADRDLWAIVAWLVDGVGGEWDRDALVTTGRIYRIPATEETS